MECRGRNAKLWDRKCLCNLIVYCNQFLSRSHVMLPKVNNNLYETDVWCTIRKITALYLRQFNDHQNDKLRSNWKETGLHLSILTIQTTYAYVDIALPPSHP